MVSAKQIKVEFESVTSRSDQWVHTTDQSINRMITLHTAKFQVPPEHPSPCHDDSDSDIDVLARRTRESRRNSFEDPQVNVPLITGSPIDEPVKMPGCET
jgi:hypothetical protein